MNGLVILGIAIAVLVVLFVLGLFLSLLPWIALAGALYCTYLVFKNDFRAWDVVSATILWILVWWLF
jgi:hypothetical protein